MRKIRGKEISMIFQDPMTALNPVLTVGEQIAEVVVLHEKCSKQEGGQAGRGDAGAGGHPPPPGPPTIPTSSPAA